MIVTYYHHWIFRINQLLTEHFWLSSIPINRLNEIGEHLSAQCCWEYWQLRKTWSNIASCHQRTKCLISVCGERWFVKLIISPLKSLNIKSLNIISRFLRANKHLGSNSESRGLDDQGFKTIFLSLQWNSGIGHWKARNTYLMKTQIAKYRPLSGVVWTHYNIIWQINPFSKYHSMLVNNDIHFQKAFMMDSDSGNNFIHAWHDVE